MYENHFQFRERPFLAGPQPASYVPAANMDHARQLLIRCVERAEGIGLVIGAAGTGKSLLCQLLAEHFRRQQFQVALLSSARLHTRRALLQNILFELNLPYRGMDDEELRLSLIDQLAPRGNSPGLVLIVDEAHTLPLRLLEEVRLVSNIVRDGLPLVRLVLSGNPSMEERLSSPKVESLTQRISARCYLAPLNREETREYVWRQIARVGGRAEAMVPQEAIRAIHNATGGIPRLINQLSDQALILAAQDGQKQLTERQIEQAWAELQQLPTPWNDPVASEPHAAAGSIEFGQLGDDGKAANEILSPHSDQQETSAPLHSLAAGDAEWAGIDDAGPLAKGAGEELLLSEILDPFGSDFDEEEIVIDRYASMEARLFPARAIVASSEGRLIGEALASYNAAQLGAAEAIDSAAGAEDQRPAVRVMDLEPDVLEPDIQESAPAGILDEEFDPSDDPVLPEIVEDAQQKQFQALPLSSPAADDRDLIVVENARRLAGRGHLAPAQRRRKSLQLLSSLRKV